MIKRPVPTPAAATQHVRTSCDLAYVAQSLDPSGIVKVGRSGSPITRIRGLRGSVPFQIETIAILANGHKRETEMKALLLSHNVKGEWYRPHEELNHYLREAHKAGAVLIAKIVDAAFAEEFIKPVVLEHLNNRPPRYNDGGNLVYRFLQEGFPAIEGRLPSMLHVCPNAISPELVNGYVPALIGSPAPQIRILANTASESERNAA